MYNKIFITTKNLYAELHVKSLPTTDDTWTKPSVLSLYTQCSGAEMGVRMRVVGKSKVWSDLFWSRIYFPILILILVLILALVLALVKNVYLLHLYLIKSWFTYYVLKYNLRIILASFYKARQRGEGVKPIST